MITSQPQVMAANDKMAATAVRRVAKRYRKETIQPLVDAIKGAKSLKGLSRRLPGLIGKMDTTAMEEGLADAEVQGAMVGRITEAKTPKSKSRNVETSKRGTLRQAQGKRRGVKAKR